MQWSHTFGTSTNDRAADVTTNISDEVFVAGYTAGQLGNVSLAYDDAYVRKLDPAGSVLWTYQFGTNGADYANSVRMDFDSNVLVGGITSGDLEGANHGNFDGFVRKLKDGTSAPEVLWTHQFGTDKDEYVHAIATDTFSDVVMTGRTLGDLSATSAGSSDVFVRKLSASGSLFWSVQFGTAGAEQGLGVGTDLTGNVYVAGYTEGDLGGTNAGGWDGFLRKLDPVDGHEIWTRQFGGAGTDAVWALYVDLAGTSYVGGWVSDQQGCQHFGGQDAFVAAYDTDGKLLWTHQFGTSFSDQVLSIAASESGGVVVGGTRDPVGPPNSRFDAFVRKLDGSGKPLWTLDVYSSASDEYTNGVWADLKGNVYAAGHDQTLNDNEAFIAKLSP